jgi:hypothetical protein
MLLKWPRRTNSVWPAPGGRGFWLRGQPKEGTTPGPRISSPGANLFATQPDALWVHFSDYDFCDIVAVESCGTSQNLNDKRSRYIPASHSLLLRCSEKWLREKIAIQGGRPRSRWKAAASIAHAPTGDLSLPIRFVRVLYALANPVYHAWCSNHVPTGHEFYCPHSSLDSYNSPKMQLFLGQMSIAKQFYVRP